jgi:hypothetical protein
MFSKIFFRIIRIYSTRQHISDKTRPAAILVGSEKSQGLLSLSPPDGSFGIKDFFILLGIPVS